MNRTNKISVTAITGFLGAGKTTFINSVLKNNPDTEFALVENEFGEVAIDTKLVKGLDASQMFELKQGCICCTISGEYELVLLELAERFPNVEHLLIETTGVADPAPVIRPFFRDEKLHSVYQYNGTVCLVDAINFENSPEKEITLKQIAVADLILVSKTDKLSEIQKRDFQYRIAQINPLCKVHFSDSGNYPGFDLDSIICQRKFFPDTSALKSVHSEIKSQTLTFQQPLNKIHFTDWLAYTLDLHKNEIYRIKGILCFENEPFEYILQGIGGSFELLEGDDFIQNESSYIVFIGKNLPVIWHELT